MKILSSNHPMLEEDRRSTGPRSLEEALSDPGSGLPKESWHIGFSKSGDLLYGTDNLPPAFQKLPTLKGFDSFSEELNRYVNSPNGHELEDFRAKMFSEPKASAVLKVFRRDLNSPPKIGIASRKTDEGYHIVFVPEGKDSDADFVLKPGFFTGDRAILSKIAEWMEVIDEGTFGNIALDILREGARGPSELDVVVRSVRGTILNYSDNADKGRIPELPAGQAKAGRWWGTLSFGSHDPSDVWIHTTLRCARVLPVATVSATAEAIREIGISVYRKALVRMAESILEWAKLFTWSEEYRYAKQWLPSAGYDVRQAERIIEMVANPVSSATVIPVHTNVKNLKEFARKTRMDEPFFWDDREEQAWILLRNTSLDDAENKVRSSFMDRMEALVGTPVSIETFLAKYVRG